MLGNQALIAEPYLQPSKTFYFILFYETGSHSVAQVDLELTILPPQPPKYKNNRCVLPCVVPAKLFEC
jgi:hypothetical protein